LSPRRIAQRGVRFRAWYLWSESRALL
jgi:hypothetical protein